jgi:hypothetical protein
VLDLGLRHSHVNASNTWNDTGCETPRGSAVEHGTDVHAINGSSIDSTDTLRYLPYHKTVMISTFRQQTLAGKI